MKYSIETCAMKSKKRQITEGIEQTTKERIRTLGERENYK